MYFKIGLHVSKTGLSVSTTVLPICIYNSLPVSITVLSVSKIGLPVSTTVLVCIRLFCLDWSQTSWAG